MERKIYEFNIDEAYNHAYDFMLLSMGADSMPDSSKHILDECLAIFDNVKNNISLKAISMKIPKESYYDSSININEEKITCNPFKEIEEKEVKGIYMTLITAGDWSSDGKISEQYFLDLWGTAFADSTKILLEKILWEDIKADSKSFDLTTGNLHLSNPFGPGYYGMPTDDTKKFGKILKCEQIGVKVSPMGIMIPEKTIAASYLVTNEETKLPDIKCSECFGSSTGCKSCPRYFK